MTPDRTLSSTDLDGIRTWSLADIRSMRTESQHAEQALSYLRKLIQGRLDIVHTYLEHPGSDALRDLGTLVNDLPGILPRARADRPAAAICPSCCPPTRRRPISPPSSTPSSAPTRSARWPTWTSSKLTDVAGRLEVLEKRVSADRRALHERIDALQAELVDRHKTGGPSVDGLLS